LERSSDPHFYLIGNNINHQPIKLKRRKWTRKASWASLQVIVLIIEFWSVHHTNPLCDANVFSFLPPAASSKSASSTHTQLTTSSTHAQATASITFLILALMLSRCQEPITESSIQGDQQHPQTKTCDASTVRSINIANSLVISPRL
jgi:hypothetical protein